MGAIPARLGQVEAFGMSGGQAKRTKAPKVSLGGPGNHRRRSVVVFGSRRKMGYAPKNATCRAVTSSLPWSLDLHHQEGTWTV